MLRKLTDTILQCINKVTAFDHHGANFVHHWEDGHHVLHLYWAWIVQSVGAQRACVQDNALCPGCRAQRVAHQITQVGLLCTNATKASIQRYCGVPYDLLHLLAHHLQIAGNHPFHKIVLLDIRGDLLGCDRHGGLGPVVVEVDRQQGHLSEIRARLEHERALGPDPLLQPAVVVPTKHQVDLGDALRQLDVVGRAHVRQRHHHLRALLQQLPRKPPALLHKVHILHLLGLDSGQRLQPFPLDQSYEAQSTTLVGDHARTLHPTQRLLGLLVQNVGHQPWEVTVSNQLFQSVQAKVKVVVANAGCVDVETVENGNHLLALGDGT
mmetsp:Transcript_25720/g.48789  ORF Transcript_25720/g.48789 Transcript_25720/m.48789 type:complete len:324 (-) Transcript_25720:50-1021(-)